MLFLLYWLQLLSRLTRECHHTSWPSLPQLQWQRPAWWTEAGRWGTEAGCWWTHSDLALPPTAVSKKHNLPRADLWPFLGLDPYFLLIGTASSCTISIPRAIIYVFPLLCRAPFYICQSYLSSIVTEEGDLPLVILPNYREVDKSLNLFVTTKNLVSEISVMLSLPDLFECKNPAIVSIYIALWLNTWYHVEKLRL